MLVLPPLPGDILRSDLDAGLSVAEMADRHARSVDYVYGRLRRLGLPVNPRPRRDWTGLAAELECTHPCEVAARRGVAVSTIYRAAKLEAIAVTRRGRGCRLGQRRCSFAG